MRQPIVFRGSLRNRSAARNKNNIGRQSLSGIAKKPETDAETVLAAQKIIAPTYNTNEIKLTSLNETNDKENKNMGENYAAKDFNKPSDLAKEKTIIKTQGELAENDKPKVELIELVKTDEDLKDLCDDLI